MAARKWRVLIADDEPTARRGVRQLLAAFPDFVVVGECRDGNEVLAALERLSPDVVFLDIQMPEIGGFDVIRRRTPERMPAVVFLTAYDQHALRAFDAAALDYLVKPVSEARFAATMKRLVKHLSGGGAEPSIVVSTSRGALVLNLREIDWIEAADYYVQLHVGKKSYLLREPMRDLEARLDPKRFMRIHRSAIVAIDRVTELRPSAHGDHCVRLRDGTDLKLSRARRGRLRVLLAMQSSRPANP